MNRVTAFLAILILFFSCKSENKQTGNISEIIPHTSALILRINHTPSFQKALGENLFLQALAGSPTGQKALDAVNNSKEFGLDFSKPFWLAGNLSGKNDPAWVILQTIEASTLDSILSNSKDSRLYENTKIHQFSEGEFYIAKLGSIMILGSDPLIVEDCIRLANTQQGSPEGLDEVLKTANTKDPFNVFVQHDYLEEWMGHYLPADWNGVSQAAGWTSLDGDFPENSVLLSGLSNFNDSLGHRYSWFEGNSPQRIRLQQVIPDGSPGFIAYGMGNALQWHRSYEKWLKRILAYDRYVKNIQTYGTQTNVVDAFISWMDNECGLFLSELKSGSPQDSYYGIFKSRNPNEALNSLKEFSNFTENYRDLPVYQLKYKNITGTVYGPPFQELKQPYFTHLGPYIVFGNSLAGLKAVVNDWYLGKTLGNHEGYNAFIDEFSTNSHIFGFSQNPGWQSWMKEFTGKSLVDSNYSNAFQFAGFQVKVEKDIAFTNILFNKPPIAPTQTRVTWSLSLDTLMIGKPHIVTNHYTKQNEVLVQDASHKIYLISTHGEILWKRQLDGKIMGEIHEMDYYKNKKYQFLFNTENTIYLLDRNGNKVENYPISLKDKATGSLALFDYDSNRNYRILIPCGKKGVLLNKEGKPVEGWKFTGSKTVITSTPQHLAAHGKDFILLRDTTNNLYILNRSGEVRIPVNQTIDFSKNPFFLDKGENLSQSKIITTTEQGAQVLIYLNGSVDLLEAEALDPNHDFLYEHGGSFVLSQDKLRIEWNGNIARASFEEMATGLQVAQMNGQRFLACSIPESQEIHLLNQEGNVLDGFPVFGETDFRLTDLELDEQPNIIVGGKDGTLYNYALD